MRTIMVEKKNRRKNAQFRILLLGFLLLSFSSGITVFNSCSRVDRIVRYSCLGTRDSIIINFGAKAFPPWDTMCVIRGPMNPGELSRIVGEDIHADSFVEQVVVFKDNGEIVHTQEWYFGYRRYHRPPYFLLRDKFVIKDRENATFVCFPTSAAYVLVPTEEYDEEVRSWIENNKDGFSLRKDF